MPLKTSSGRISRKNKCRANLRLVKHCKRGVVPLSEWATTRHHTAISRIADGLEFPHAANQFEVTDVLTGFGEHTNHLTIQRGERELQRCVALML